MMFKRFAYLTLLFTSHVSFYDMSHAESSHSVFEKTDFDEKALAQVLPVYEPEIYSGYYAGTLFTDKDLQRLIVKAFPSIRDDFQKAGLLDKDGEPYDMIIDKHGVFAGLVYAFRKDLHDDPQIRDLQIAIREKYKGILDQDDIRMTCLSLVADQKDNPPFLGSDPGMIHDSKGVSAPHDTTTANVIAELEEDGFIILGSDPYKIQIPEGYRLAMLYMRDGFEFHMIRLDQDRNGGLVATGKFGLSNEIHRFEIGSGGHFEDLYDLMQYDFKKTIAFEDQEYTRQYAFSTFVLLPEAGVDVGIAGYLRQKGLVSQAATRAEIDLAALTYYFPNMK